VTRGAVAVGEAGTEAMVDLTIHFGFSILDFGLKSPVESRGGQR